MWFTPKIFCRPDEDGKPHAAASAYSSAAVLGDRYGGRWLLVEVPWLNGEQYTGFPRASARQL